MILHRTLYFNHYHSFLNKIYDDQAEEFSIKYQSLEFNISPITFSLFLFNKLSDLFVVFAHLFYKIFFIYLIHIINRFSRHNINNDYRGNSFINQIS